VKVDEKGMRILNAQAGWHQLGADISQVKINKIVLLTSGQH